MLWEKLKLMKQIRGIESASCGVVKRDNLPFYHMDDTETANTQGKGSSGWGKELRAKCSEAGGCLVHWRNSQELWWSKYVKRSLERRSETWQVR